MLPLRVLPKKMATKMIPMTIKGGYPTRSQVDCRPLLEDEGSRCYLSSCHSSQRAYQGVSATP